MVEEMNPINCCYYSRNLNLYLAKEYTLINKIILLKDQIVVSHSFQLVNLLFLRHLSDLLLSFLLIYP